MTDRYKPNVHDVKQLHDATGRSTLDCKGALEFTGGDYHKARLLLAANPAPLIKEKRVDISVSKEDHEDAKQQEVPFSERMLSELWPAHTQLMRDCEEIAKLYEKAQTAQITPHTIADIFRTIGRLAALGRGR